MILEAGGLEEYGRRADHFEISIGYWSKWPHCISNLVLRMDIRGRRMEGPRGAPDHKRSHRKNEEERDCNHTAHGHDGRPFHDYLLLTESEL
jgi:hypothetical protein